MNVLRLDCIREAMKSAALVVHGGTIMSILDGFAVPHEDFYFWQVKMPGVMKIELDEQQWNKGKER